MLILAVLQSMYHHGSTPVRAPKYFRINHDNATGKRLYKITTGHRLLVTNSTGVCGVGPKSNAPVDLTFLASAVLTKDWDLFLVCGVQAQEAFVKVVRRTSIMRSGKVIFMPHPASRTLTNALCARVTTLINAATRVSTHLIQERGHVREEQL